MGSEKYCIPEEIWVKKKLIGKVSYIFVEKKNETKLAEKKSGIRSHFLIDVSYWEERGESMLSFFFFKFSSIFRSTLF